MADIKKLEKELWEAADNLRANSKLTSQQYCMPVLGLIFLRYAWGRFKMADAQINESRTQAIGRQIPIEPADYTTLGAMFIPEEARYDFLLNLPESEKNLGKRVDDAMAAIEKQNPQLAGVLPRNYTDLGDDLLAETLRIFNNPALDEDGDDIIGRIYEYFLGKFAPAVASDDGVFFTPKSLVRMIMNVIEPKRGVMLDPACGSGGMFVSASDYVREYGGNPADLMTYYGQEKVEYNAKLCLMNMAVHGMNGRILSGDEANTFYHDAHSLDGSCDYVAANPPWEYTDVSGLCKIATQQEIEEKNWSLTPGAHVGVPPQEDDGVDFHERMGEIHEELLRLQTESNELMATITRNLEELGLHKHLEERQ
ncbi:MAG: SAM-dependent DNA methyltransferase [Atopobiaceae bacterium]|nr:SAM-dependent DNA methyltransferase [Atopobiaceae bacterium]